MYFVPNATILSRSSTKKASLSLSTSFHIVWIDKSLECNFTYPWHILVDTNAKILRNVTKTGSNITIVPVIYGLNGFKKVRSFVGNVVCIKSIIFLWHVSCSKIISGLNLFANYDECTRKNVSTKTFSTCNIIYRCILICNAFFFGISFHLFN